MSVARLRDCFIGMPVDVGAGVAGVAVAAAVVVMEVGPAVPVAVVEVPVGPLVVAIVLSVPTGVVAVSVPGDGVVLGCVVVGGDCGELLLPTGSYIHGTAGFVTAGHVHAKVIVSLGEFAQYQRPALASALAENGRVTVMLSKTLIVAVRRFQSRVKVTLMRVACEMRKSVVRCDCE